MYLQQDMVTGFPVGFLFTETLSIRFYILAKAFCSATTVGTCMSFFYQEWVVIL